MCIDGIERSLVHPRVRRPTLLVAAILVAGCNGTTSYLDATGKTGRDEAVLGAWLTGVACAVVLLVCLAIVGGIGRAGSGSSQGNDDANRASDTRRREIRSGLNWIYIGVAITVAILLVTFGGTMVTLRAASRPPTVPRLTLDVTGHQWWWEVRYSDPQRPELAFTTANEVHLPVGLPVRVRLHAADVIHSFWLPQIAGKTDVIPGQVNEMWLEADRPGVSRGMCGEYCGLQHAMMAMTVTAESPEAFNRWAQSRRAPAANPTTPKERAGEVVFARSCGACHAVQGTNALGRVGPELTHFAARSSIGAGVLRNTPENLMRWITNAPSIKEGARMPAVPLDAGELRAVVAYLETLR
jgi:cytochrome c oxidase subunit 2